MVYKTIGQFNLPVACMLYSLIKWLYLFFYVAAQSRIWKKMILLNVLPLKKKRGLFIFLQCRYLHIPHGTLKKAFYCFKLENLKKNVVSCTSFKTTNLLNASILQFIFLIHPRRWKKTRCGEYVRQLRGAIENTSTSKLKDIKIHSSLLS